MPGKSFPGAYPSRTCLVSGPAFIIYRPDPVGEACPFHRRAAFARAPCLQDMSSVLAQVVRGCAVHRRDHGFGLCEPSAFLLIRMKGKPAGSPQGSIKASDVAPSILQIGAMEGYASRLSAGIAAAAAEGPGRFYRHNTWHCIGRGRYQTHLNPTCPDIHHPSAELLQRPRISFASASASTAA